MIDQKVFAVYFDKSKKVTRLANYGMEDGKVGNFSDRSTSTTGAESSMVKNMMLNPHAFRRLGAFPESR